MLNNCLDKGPLRQSWFSRGTLLYFSSNQRTWLFLWKCSRGNHLSAKRRLRDRVTCGHFLGMIGMFLSKQVVTVRWWAVHWWLPWPPQCVLPPAWFRKTQLFSRWCASSVTTSTRHVLAGRMCQVMLERDQTRVMSGCVGDDTQVISGYDADETQVMSGHVGD